MDMTIDIRVYGKKSWSQSFRDRHIHKRKMDMIKKLHSAETGMRAVQNQFPAQDPRQNYGGWPAGRSVLAGPL